jgi:hypothetical protein
VYADGTLSIERSEPATAEAKHDQYEQWYARVNSECDCSVAAVLCGDRYKAVMQTIAAQGATSCKKQRLRWCKRARNISYRWSPDSKHYSKQSATCDHAHTPRELLPRMGHRGNITPDKWPYLSQRTINDVLAMRFIRSAHGNKDRNRQDMWQKLQQRLQQYATTGAGTVAEAIVTIDNWWSCQVAHEVPSGGKSKAMKRRYSKGSEVQTSDAAATTTTM